MLKAKLISEIPKERFRTIDGSVPKIGDIVSLDHGFTFANGKAGCLVYGIGLEGKYKFEAEVYETEIGENIDT